MFVPDFNAGKMVVNNAGGIEQTLFSDRDMVKGHGRFLKQRHWRGFIDESIMDTGMNRSSYNASGITGIRRYDVIPSDI